MSASSHQPEEWLPAGEEPLPIGAITHYLVLRNNGTSMLSCPDGEIDVRREPATGMYRRDTRYLSRLILSFGGVTPTLLDAREVDNGLSAVYTNPSLRPPTGTTVPAQTLVIRRRRVITRGMLESLSLSNYGQHAIDMPLRIEFDADFNDIFVVRGYQRQTPVPEVRAEVKGDHVVFNYEGADGIERRTTVMFRPAPKLLMQHQATFLVHLQPTETATVELEVVPDDSSLEGSLERATTRGNVDRQAWLVGIARMEADDEALEAAQHRGILDIEALRTKRDDQEFMAAGVPWFDSLFGRDSLITGMSLLAFTPDVLRNSLEVLARHQATETDAVHDATPGKIPHELRWGELSNIGEVPFGRYYGSVDATPLFIVACHEYLRWTSDIATTRRLWPAVQAAMAWCVRQLEESPNGFLSYARKSVAGLENQGWKDSHDSIIWPDGDRVEPPIALVEVQGYLARAFSAYALLGAAVRDAEAAGSGWRAQDFAAKIDKAFGHEELGYVLALDGRGRPVPTPSSNSGHMLWAGVARRDLAEIVARRLLEPDMFSGWGVRTLGLEVSGYNPLGYHTGSVWPHDNAMFLHGLRWYGFDQAASKLANALLQAAMSFPDYRVPELFSGDPRELRLVPTPYPVASRPQAWSAASVPFVLSSLLGLYPLQPGRLCISRPQLPRNIDWLAIRNLRLAGGSVDLSFRRSGENVAVEVEDIKGGIDVVMSTTWPSIFPLQERND